MTHNEFEIWSDIIRPLLNYWKESEFVLPSSEKKKFKVNNKMLPEEYTERGIH